MKKIYYSFTVGLALVGLVLTGLLSGCEDVNDQFNQHDLDSLTQIRNVVTYNYTLTSTDYGDICTKFQAPITAIIKPKEDTIKVYQDSITNHLFIDVPDSLKMIACISVLNDKISALKLDPTYVQGNLFKTEKYISNSVLTDPIYVAALLNTKYKYAENYGKEKSAIFLTYFSNDTTYITQKATMTTANYDAMGTQTGQPGKNDYFSSAIDPTFYIPIFLKQNFPYAKIGDVWLIRYKYYISSSSTVNRYIVCIYDGTTWKTDGPKTPLVAKFVIKDGSWKYSNNDILVGLNTGIGSNLGDFTAISVVGAQVWAWNAYNYMMMTGYLAPNYLDNDDWLVSPAMDLSERGDSTFLTFTHTGKYFGTDMLAGAKKQATVWISTTSDGTSINMSDWTQLTLRDSDYNFGTGWVWASVTPIKLTDYIGHANVRIAFRYLSETSDGWAGTYELKNVYVYQKEE